MPTVLPPPRPPSTGRSLSLVVPMLGERQDRFVERAERALRTKIVDRNSRMSSILQAWSESGEEAALQQRTRESLAASIDCPVNELDQHFITRPNRPIFDEHSAVDARGRVQRYDRAALVAIVGKLNGRIMDTGDLSALSAGHTPDPDQQAMGMPMPECVGYAGPFRLGLIGNDAPRWAIFSDEHIFRDDWPQVRKMSRRSVEITMDPQMSERILDPIAVLGAEAPRRDTGIGRFSRGRLDAARYVNSPRTKYSVGAMPGGMNTFSPAIGDDEPSRNSRASTQETDPMTMDQATIDEIVSSVLQGITATPQWAYLTDQMGTANNPVPEDDDLGPPSTEEQIPDPAVPGDLGGMEGDQPGMGADAVAAGEQGTPPGYTPPAPAPEAAMDMNVPAPEANGSPEDESGATNDELGQMPPEEREEYSKMAPSHQYGYAKAWRRHAAKGAGAQRYSKGAVDVVRYRKLEGQVTSLQSENTRLKSEQVFTERYSKLRDLSEQFEFDIEEEAEDCRAMAADAFNRHLDRIQTRYSRRDPMGGMPGLHLEPLQSAKTADEVTVEKYSRRAVELSTRSNGKMGYAEALEQAKSEVLGTKSKAV